MYSTIKNKQTNKTKQKDSPKRTGQALIAVSAAVISLDVNNAHSVSQPRALHRLVGQLKIKNFIEVPVAVNPRLFLFFSKT